MRLASFHQLAALLMLTFSMAAHAEVVPKGSNFDPRVRVIDYNASNVVRIATFYGVSTHVQFGDDENITDIAVGDDQAWSVVPRGNHMFVKPKAKNADTNITVLTNKHVYHFALVVAQHSLKDADAWRDPDLVYGLSFRYPDELTKKLAEKLIAESRAEEQMLAQKALEDEKKQKEQALQEEIKLRDKLLKSSFKKGKKQNQIPLADKSAANGSIRPIMAESNTNDIAAQADNEDYWAAGSKEITPTAASDDGRFTYLTFSHNRDMPAVYSVDAFDNEALINTSVEGNTIIVHRVVEQLRLRKGDAVVCIRNKAFNLDGGTDNETGTVLPNIERITQEPK